MKLVVAFFPRLLRGFHDQGVDRQVRGEIAAKLSRPFLACALFALLASCRAQGAAATVRGFVTRIVAPSDVYLGALHVVEGPRTQCSVEDLDSDIQVQNKMFGLLFSQRSFAMHNRPYPETRRGVSCAAIDLRVGTYAEIVGDYTDAHASLRAVRVTVYRVTVQQRVARLPEPVEGGALIEEEPRVSRRDHGWVGTVWLDGYPMKLSTDTAILTAPTGTELSFRGFGFPQFYPRWGAVMPHTSAPGVTESLLRQNTWATYQVRDAHDGQYVGEVKDRDTDELGLVRMRLWPNHVSANEERYRARLTPMIHAPDFSRAAPGRIGFTKTSPADEVRILADSSVQRFVTSIGDSVVPGYQRDLADQDRTRITFRFFVTEGLHRGTVDPMTGIGGFGDRIPKRLGEGVAALPNGVVLLPDTVLARLSNEAQLAMLLSCAVTAVLQKQSYVARFSHPEGWQPEYGSNPVQLVLPLLEDEQALRIGIREMYLAGYDIREAPFAWAAAAGKSVANPMLDSASSSDAASWYTAYAFDYISRYYRNVDYSKLKLGEAEYQGFLRELRKVDPEAFAGQ